MAARDKTTLESLERWKNTRQSKIFYNKKITTNDEWIDYIRWERQLLIDVFKFDNIELFNLFYKQFLNSKDSYMMTCRRWGKSQQVAIVMFIRLLNLPWFNACHSTKYDKRIGEIAQLYKNSIDILANNNLITLEEKYALYQSVKTTWGVTFAGRQIFFIAINLPDKTYVAGTDEKGYQGLIVFYIIDEILYENESQLDYSINDDQQIQFIGQIEKNINRGLKSPFGISFKRIWCFNPWDLSHKICYEVSNLLFLDYRNTSNDYVNKYKENVNELVNGNGIVFYENDESTYLCAGFNSMPKERRDVLQKYYDKEKIENKSVWLVAYCGVPNLSLDTSLATYWSLNGKDELPYNTFNMENIPYAWLLGIDVGTKDDTAAVLAKLFKIGNKSYLEVVDIYTTNNKTHSIIGDEIIALLEKNKIVDVDIHCDPRGGGSNLMLEINNRDNCRYVVHSAAAKSQWKEIPFRVAKINQLIYNNNILIASGKNEVNIKLFNHLKAIQNFSADNLTHAGERNEKTTRFSLDIINAFEYMLTYDWREW